MASNKEAKVKFTAETSEFSQGISNINKSLGNLRSDLKLVNTEIKANGASFDSLSDKQRTLQSIVGDLSSKLELQGNKLEAAKRLFGENSDEVNKLYRGYNNIQGELIKYTSELDKTTNELKQFDNACDDASSGTQELDRALDDLEDSARDAGDGFTITKGAIADFAGGLLTSAKDAIVNTVTGLVELVEETKEYREMQAKLKGSTDEVNHSFEKTTEKYQELYGYLIILDSMISKKQKDIASFILDYLNKVL